MGCVVLQLGEKEGFAKPVMFSSDLDEQAMQKAFDDFRKQCVGVAKEHLPHRCPVLKKGETYELLLDERNLTYNFDSLLSFLGTIMSKGMVKAAKVLNGGAYGASAYLVTPGSAVKFDCFPSSEVLAKIQVGTVSFMDILKDKSGRVFAEAIKNT